MLNILVNAYAVSPAWGSEPGMGWNWIVNLARYNRLDVITEGEWRDEIEAALAGLPHRDNLTFHYLPVSDSVRRMCWNQGDWRFYGHYRKWQRRALETARGIMAAKRIDVLHQLNMIGFREPGYLWKIAGVPLVWGPVGGMGNIPVAYLADAPLKHRAFSMIKNCINRLQYTMQPRVRKMIRRSDVIVSAVSDVQRVLADRYGKISPLINETGTSGDGGAGEVKKASSGALKVIWVGKFDFRKQLPLALKSIAAMDSRDVEFHICGTASPQVVAGMKALAGSLGIGERCVWHGVVPHDRILQLMSDCDLMFFTSIMDATSTVVLEALSVDLPVLCLDTCGYGPIVRDFGGIAVPLTDTDTSVRDFAGILSALARDKQPLDDMSRRIHSRKHELSWDSKARRMTEIYRSLAGRSE